MSVGSKLPTFQWPSVFPSSELRQILMIETQVVLETWIILNQLTRLIAREDFIKLESSFVRVPDAQTNVL
jgi:hypothetical protein